MSEFKKGKLVKTSTWWVHKHQRINRVRIQMYENMLATHFLDRNDMIVKSFDYVITEGVGNLRAYRECFVKVVAKENVSMDRILANINSNIKKFV